VFLFVVDGISVDDQSVIESVKRQLMSTRLSQSLPFVIRLFTANSWHIFPCMITV